MRREGGEKRQGGEAPLHQYCHCVCQETIGAALLLYTWFDAEGGGRKEREAGEAHLYCCHHFFCWDTRGAAVLLYTWSDVEGGGREETGRWSPSPPVLPLCLLRDRRSGSTSPYSPVSPPVGTIPVSDWMSYGHCNISGNVDEAFILVFLSRGLCVVSAPETGSFLRWNSWTSICQKNQAFCSMLSTVLLFYWRILQKTMLCSGFKNP